MNNSSIKEDGCIYVVRFNRPIKDNKWMLGPLPLPMLLLTKSHCTKTSGGYCSVILQRRNSYFVWGKYKTVHVQCAGTL